VNSLAQPTAVISSQQNLNVDEFLMMPGKASLTGGAINVIDSDEPEMPFKDVQELLK